MKQQMSKKTLILLSLFLLVISITLLPSCSEEIDVSDRTKKQNVALIVKMKHGDYWRTVKMGAEAAAKEFDVNLKFYAADYEEDVLAQINFVSQSLREETDALVLSASDYKALSGITDKAASLNIPVITIDSEVMSSGVKSFIGTDNYEAGKQAAQQLIQLTGEQSKIALMGTMIGARNLEQREKGFLDEVAKHPGVILVAKEYCFSNQNLASDLTKKIVANNEQLDGIFALTGLASNGVANTIEELGLNGKVKIVAFDNTPEVMEHVQEGGVQATIVQNPYNMGYLGVKYAVEAMHGETVPNRIDTHTQVITQENMFSPENQQLLFPLAK
ncbi:substrate-binding domain-containing protein [Brevibacillus sp. SYSU BS000544]|uniref:substrate-binding domain-containing protein n=1 Tax=Brevibacillus sp. SYSU BS000544 TaxID=3416443 RepID=UPI003CE5C39F